MVALDRHRGAAGEADALDHVGIERALGEEIGAADLRRLGLENVDEGPADQLALGLGLVEPGEAAEELVGRVHMDQRECCNGCGTGETTCSASFARIRPWSTKTQVSWWPIASWISTAATALSTPPERPQITLPSPDLRADVGDLGRAIFGHRPVAGQAADVADEIGEQLAAVRRVDDLGVEHQAEEAALLVGGDRIGRAFGRGDDAEAFGQRLDPVAMAHPDLVGLARLPEAVEQHANRR